jgi:hypothetical protein
MRLYTPYISFFAYISYKAFLIREDKRNKICFRNGFDRSGLFCVVYKLLEKLEAERQVSVVNVVRKIRTHRPQSITSMVSIRQKVFSNIMHHCLIKSFSSKFFHSSVINPSHLYYLIINNLSTVLFQDQLSNSRFVPKSIIYLPFFFFFRKSIIHLPFCSKINYLSTVLF